MRFLPALFLMLLVPFTPDGKAYTLDEDLIYRINFGSAEDVKVLLDKGANPNAHTNQGENALTIAIDRMDGESLGMVKALLDKNADAEYPDRGGNTPLISAVKNGQVEIVKLLLAKGANFRVLSTAGTPLIDMAKQQGNKDVIKAIQELIDKEDADAAAMRTPERFKGIVRDYAYSSCTFQYWNYFLSSRQSPEKDPETQKKVAEIKDKLTDLVKQMQKYYPTAPTAPLQTLSTSVIQQIYESLDSMISNRNRMEHGVGREEDAKERCQRIIADVHIDFVPPPSAQPSHTDTPLPLPPTVPPTAPPMSNKPAPMR